MKVLTIVGARPQLVKAAAVSRVLRKKHKEILVHTGQHYDDNMSEVFFRELGIPRPNYNLGIGGGGHSAQTGAMLSKIEEILLKERPGCVLLYGDTNSTLAGALSASKLHIPVVHIEAGLRSYNRKMPEEVNRVLTDHVSSLLLCPSPIAVTNLLKEGIRKGVHIVGDVMYDVLKYADKKSPSVSTLTKNSGLSPKSICWQQFIERKTQTSRKGCDLYYLLWQN
jgi:UDP-GlcNAc3NAcA epimerase